MKKALITGITGQDGAYLSKILLDKGYKVFGTSRKDKPNISNLENLSISSRVEIIKLDLQDKRKTQSIVKNIQPDEIYNFAGQGSVNLSFESPFETITENVTSVLNLLESIRISLPNVKFFQATTSEMFGNETIMPINEKTPLNPSNPYGVSKSANFLSVKNYRETFGIFCVSGILFNHESAFRPSFFFIRGLIQKVISISLGVDDFVNVGQWENKRDFGFAPKYMEAVWLMLQNKIPKDYVISSGHSISIKEIVEYVFKKLNVPTNRIKIDKKLFRTPNVKNIIGDNSRAKKELGWVYDMSFFEVLDILIDDELKQTKKK